MTSMMWSTVFLIFFGNDPTPIEVYGPDKFTTETRCVASAKSDATDIMNDNTNGFIRRIEPYCVVVSGHIGSDKKNKKNRNK